MPINLVKELIRPHTPEVIADHFARGETLLIRGEVDKAETVLPGFTRPELLEHLLEGASAVGGFVGAYLDSAAVRRTGYPGLRIKAEDAVHALTLPSCALTLYSVEEFNEHVRTLVTSFQTEFNIGGLSGASIWRSVGKFVVPPHSDAADVLQIQLQGEKRWRVAKFGDPDGFTELRGLDDQNTYTVQTADGKTETRQVDPDSFIEFVAKPGDVLLLPRGTWHQTWPTTDQTSMALTLWHQQQPLWELFSRWLESEFETDKDWLQPPLLPQSTRENPGKFLEYLRGRLDQVAGRLSDVDSVATSFLNEWGQLTAAAVATNKLGQPQSRQPIEFSRSSTFERVAEQPLALGRNEEGGVVLYCGPNKDLIFDADESHELPKLIASNDRFSGADALASTRIDEAGASWEDVAERLRAMLEIGVIRVCTSAVPRD